MTYPLSTEHSPTKSIPTEEIQFHPTSFCDEEGRVFWWRGSLYRGISPHYAPLCQEMFAAGVVASLIQQGFLVETELTDWSLPNYPLVLKHRQISFVSYVSEWCPAMLAEAAQFTLNMMQALSPHGLTVDIGTWDILFDGAQPRYVDFCSIAAADSYTYRTWNSAIDDFRSYFINPLRLMNKGYGNMARWLLKDYEHRVIHAELASLLGQRIYGLRECDRSVLSKVRSRITQAYSNLKSRRDPCRQDLIHQMQQELNRVSPPVGRITSCPEPNNKQRCVRELLRKLQPKTMLDVGCGAGSYSAIAAQMGVQVVAVDCDDSAVTTCYQMAKAQQLSILPLVMDIRYPTPGQGSGHQVITPAVKRLSCELVLALDILHLLVFEQQLTLPQAVDSLAAFSTRWLLIEFSTDAVVSGDTDMPTDDSCDDLVWLLQQRFERVRVVSDNDLIVPLILCER